MFVHFYPKVKDWQVLEVKAEITNIVVKSNDYNEEAVIIGTGGKANVKIATNFSADNLIIKSDQMITP